MQVSRREFVKTAAILSGLAAVGWKADGKQLHTLVKSSVPLGPADKVVAAICPGAG